MKKHQCSVCGYVYDEVKGDASCGIPPGTNLDALPPEWTCPECGAVIDEFREMVESPIVFVSPTQLHAQDDAAPAIHVFPEHTDTMRKRSTPEFAAVCSNIEKNCRKMNCLPETKYLLLLAGYFLWLRRCPKNVPVCFLKNAFLLEQDLSSGYPVANNIVRTSASHAALPTLSWRKKTSGMQKSLLAHFVKDGSAMLGKTTFIVARHTDSFIAAAHYWLEQS